MEPQRGAMSVSFRECFVVPFFSNHPVGKRLKSSSSFSCRSPRYIKRASGSKKNEIMVMIIMKLKIELMILMVMMMMMMMRMMMRMKLN